MLRAYKRVGGCVAKISVADNFDMIGFFSWYHNIEALNGLVSNASITNKYISFMLKDNDRGPCIDKQYSRQLWGGWVGLPLYAISIQKEILTIMDDP